MAFCSAATRIVVCSSYHAAFARRRPCPKNLRSYPKPLRSYPNPAMPRPKPSLKARALRYLSMREHGRLELARKLARYAEEGDDIDALLDWLQTSKFLSEPRFAESLVNRRSARFGNSRIVSELQSHGINPATVAALKINLVADEEARAWLVWEKKIWHSTGRWGRVRQTNAIFTAARFFAWGNPVGHAAGRPGTGGIKPCGCAIFARAPDGQKTAVPFAISAKPPPCL